jgi:hypothetical protein
MLKLSHPVNPGRVPPRARLANRAALALLAAATIAPVPEMVAAAVLPGVNLMAAAQAAQLNLGPIQPRPGFGVTSLYNVFLAHDNGRPIPNGLVQFWFSGPNGVRLGIGTFRTNTQGRISFLATIPRNWKGIPWVNLNAASTSAGVATHWRILN